MPSRFRALNRESESSGGQSVYRKLFPRGPQSSKNNFFGIKISRPTPWVSLSVLLWLLYCYIFDSTCDPLIMGECKINCLLYADDLILLSESEHGLQRCLAKLSCYAKKWQMRINIKKKKAILFNKSGKIFGSEFQLGNQPIQITDSYVYLGRMVSVGIRGNSGSIWNEWSSCSSSCCLRLVHFENIFLIGSTRFSSTPRGDKSWLFLRELE